MSWRVKKSAWKRKFSVFCDCWLVLAWDSTHAKSVPWKQTITIWLPLTQEDQNNGHNSGHALKGGSASNTAHTYGKFHTGEAHCDSTRMLLQINNPEKSTFHFVPKAETPSGRSVLAFHIIANHFQNVCVGVCVHACRYIPTYRCALQKRVLVGLLYYFLPFPKRHGPSLSLELRWLTACKQQWSSPLFSTPHSTRDTGMHGHAHWFTWILQNWDCCSAGTFTHRAVSLAH